MAKENKKEISFVEGPIFQSLIRFALPVLGALILQAAYGAVDLLVVGWFGDASSISAVGTGSNFMQMVTLIITSLAMGSTVMIGQHIGEGKPDKAGKTVGTSIVLFAIRRNKNTGHLISNLGDRCLCCRRITDHLDDL